MTMNCYFPSVLNLFIVAVCRPSGDKLASNIGRENDGYDESRQNSLHTIFFFITSIMLLRILFGDHKYHTLSPFVCLCRPQLWNISKDVHDI